MINDKLTYYRTHHETFLKQVIQNLEIPAKRIQEAMHYALFPGGKRLRPMLVYLTGEVIDAALPSLDRIAAAIELTHAYSLIHDDLPAMDNDDFRRGKPSCHRKFDEATAILVGDGMQALAVDILLTELPQFLEPSQVIAVTRELVHASGPSGMVSGQSLDLSELNNINITEAQLCAIHTLKTGKLISACINMATVVGNPDDSLKAALCDYAHYLGLVFQMQDDYLDAYAPMTRLGKNRASDVANQKITFAQLYEQQALFELINSYFQKAKDKLTPFTEKTKTLIAFTETLQVRSELAEI
ncbi:geranyltranstransferase [Legionella beliardensis]|uniref:Geranyltranstransferase n=1 Tax=Legionella beliardensis TaxID=91822 RepID=A0A378HZA1_9GAMM|nr:farnesyl diphosphate synthase [Legionella beliardensis]STX28082.1 geranyltranstransferase [Legionella beliardensis]